MGLDYCFIPDELYLTRKMSIEPEFVFPSKSPSVSLFYKEVGFLQYCGDF